MTDELLPFYNRELAFIREMGAEFAQRNPKIAGRLRWSGDMSEDPHVSRMIEAFAFLNARISHKLDDDFPELTEALLGVLYPHYLAPFPSAAIVQTEISRDQGELTAGYSIKSGSVIEQTESVNCQFRTSYDVQLFPIEVSHARYQSQPFSAPVNRLSRDAVAVMTITLKAFSDKVIFDQFPLKSLRIYLDGQGQHIHDLYESLLNNCLGIALAANATDPHAVTLASDCVTPVGFDEHEGLLDYPARSFLGYRLLTEYFSFPEKFMFVDIGGFTAENLQLVGQNNELRIYLYLDRHIPDLEQRIDQSNFKLGCTPVVNLYKQRAEPITWSHTEAEYRVIPDARRPMQHELFAITRVMATSPDDETVEFAPFYSTRHTKDANSRTFWHATRRPAASVPGRVDEGTEVFLTLVDLDAEPANLAQWTVDVETICLNRDLPSHLQADTPLQLSSGGPLGKLAFLTLPTQTYRPHRRQQYAWKLVSHLSLNHMSLFDTEHGAEALREILMLYDPTNSVETRNLIRGLRQVSNRRIVGRVPGHGASGFCRGVEVTLELDEERFSGAGVFLFASVMERFLAQYCSLNSFTKTVAKTDKRVLAQWRPRAGDMVLV